MFGRRAVSVNIGDLFIEPLLGKKRIFKALGIADRSAPEAFETFWEVTELVDFNGMPHARLHNAESDITRTIAVEALARQDNYKKK